ncbi:hypothetical protein ABZO31_29965 [Streptomyces sp. HUAS MG47]|uniref:hypothetical protein n=1 Tax=Streptomyces solicamelliae TaxID=3231716 RepID=UPI003877BD9F
MNRRVVAALALAAALTVGGCTADEKPAGKPAGDGPGVDLVYLNHPPMQPVLKDIDAVLDDYEGRISVTRHEADSTEGAEFAEEHGLTGHVSIAVLIDGKLRFQGFPAGRAPIKSAEGDWRIEDLDAALRQETGS